MDFQKVIWFDFEATFVTEISEMEGKSPASSLNFSNLQESFEFDSLFDEWVNALEGVDIDSEGGGDEASSWMRVSWTDKMVKLLITAASYIGGGAFADSNSSGNFTSLLLPRIGKWKAISMALVERGFKVSAQQCEDKFNDLNKKYKRLNTILGNGISCRVVENPKLLHILNIPGHVKEEAYRILTSKQLLYKELCSYHHKNRLFLPHDRELQWQLMTIVRGENGLQCCGEPEAAKANGDSSRGKSAKRTKMGSHPPIGNVRVKNALTQGGQRELLGNEQMSSCWLQLEVQKLELQKQKLQLEKQRIKWLRFSQMEDQKMDEMRLENESLKLDNARLAFELKRQEMMRAFTSK